MSEASKLGKIFIGGLSYETTDEKLRSYFSTFGSVTDAVVMKDPISRRSRGFGFITYADPGCVDRALAQPSHVLDSRRVEAKRAVPRADSLRETTSTPTKVSVLPVMPNGTSLCTTSGATKKIFVGGLHYETKDAEFKKYFQKYGKVVSAEVMFNRETNKSRGFGFVVFEAEQSVDLILNERDHIIDGKTVEVKRAVPRTDVPPMRAITTRANSSSASGSVESLDSNGSSHLIKSDECHASPCLATKQAGSKANNAKLLPNGMLGGYAAAVRYGGRGGPQKSVSSPIADSNDFNDSFTHSSPIPSTMDYTLGGVADALGTMDLREENSPRTSKASSNESCEKLPESFSNDSAFEGFRNSVSASLSIPHWDIHSKLSPLHSPLTKEQGITSHSFPESSFLSPALTDSSNTLAWQTPSWQQPWGTKPSEENTSSDSRSPLGISNPATSPTSLFSMFSPTRSNAWTSQGLEDSSKNNNSTGFGGMMGMDLHLHSSANTFGDKLGIHNGSAPFAGIFSESISSIEPSNGSISALDEMLGSLHEEDNDTDRRAEKEPYGFGQNRGLSGSSLGAAMQQPSAFFFPKQSR